MASGALALNVFVAPIWRASPSFSSERSIARTFWGTGSYCTEQCCQADATEAYHSDGVTGLYAGRVDNGANAGHNGAIEQCGLVERKFAINLDD